MHVKFNFIQRITLQMTNVQYFLQKIQARLVGWLMFHAAFNKKLSHK